MCSVFSLDEHNRPSSNKWAHLRTAADCASERSGIRATHNIFVVLRAMSFTSIFFFFFFNYFLRKSSVRGEMLSNFLFSSLIFAVQQTTRSGIGHRVNIGTTVTNTLNMRNVIFL